MRQPAPDPTNARRGAEPRHALVCTHCGDVAEFEADALAPLRESLARRLGFEVTGHRLQLFGRCAACRLSGGDTPTQGWGRA